KADAYGHGAVACALALEREGADWFGVALPEEGEALREAGITRPMLCLGGFWEGQEEALLAAQLTPVLYRLDLLERLDAAARRPGGVLYGLWRDVVNPQTARRDWRAVLALRTRIIHLKTVARGTPLGYGGTFSTARESLIATLAIGYEDGLPRALSNRGRVLVR